MKKHLAIIVVLILSLTLLGMSEKPTIISLGLPTYGSATLDDEGQIIGFTGPNLGLGWSWKHYFEPLEIEKFNPYWGIGTVVLFIPYISLGGDYAIELNTNILLIGVEVALPYAFGIDIGYIF
ncbi:MAG: hypothetical protein H0Z25_10130 [Kosmotoga sp.]|uniref:hypothetical protein n=1 Tax=Kosmotoga sp. TaxID=1955248 RepID=UPI001DF25A84|nr:hypothetical protein [Kosmotoga sp.]MBO8167546.1 hypothetical protein [Kosmotoga sp.]